MIWSHWKFILIHIYRKILSVYQFFLKVVLKTDLFGGTLVPEYAERSNCSQFLKQAQFCYEIFKFLKGISKLFKFMWVPLCWVLSTAVSNAVRRLRRVAFTTWNKNEENEQNLIEIPCRWFFRCGRHFSGSSPHYKKAQLVARSRRFGAYMEALPVGSQNDASLIFDPKTT